MPPTEEPVLSPSEPVSTLRPSLEEAVNHRVLQDERLAFIVGPGGHKSRAYKRTGRTLAWGTRQVAVGAVQPAAAVASLAALPGGASALHGVEDLVVDDGAIGAVQGHAHGLRLRRGAAGALVLHIFRVDGVQGFAGTLTLQQAESVRALR